jgi:hypothetical protein
VLLTVEFASAFWTAPQQHMEQEIGTYGRSTV